jgi:hypothetical protein
MATQYEELEKRVTILEKLAEKLSQQKLKVRKSREYTDEQKAEIRKRLLAGQEAARKRKETKTQPIKKTEATKNNKPERAVKAEKPNVTKPVVSQESKI